MLSNIVESPSFTSNISPFSLNFKELYVEENKWVKPRKLFFFIPQTTLKVWRKGLPNVVEESQSQQSFNSAEYKILCLSYAKFLTIFRKIVLHLISRNLSSEEASKEARSKAGSEARSCTPSCPCPHSRNWLN